MSFPLTFKGRVAIVTGAGGGLGKAYALLFAQRGASVVVNDLGGDYLGGGKSRVADKVVDEIRLAGGRAVANYDSVEEGEKIVKTAITNFGRIDILVNNAGILRDKSFLKMTNDDWDKIHNVHLRGSFLVTRAAWPQMRKQQYGRIIMTSSASGVYGNFGQANYSAAKNGLVGLSHTLAKEGAKYNIKCNAVAPIAGSRMTATVMPEEVLKIFEPNLVAPLVVYLCHESCGETGGLFESGAGWNTKLRVERTRGYAKQELTLEDIAKNWGAVTDFSRSEVGGDSTMVAIEKVKSGLTHVPSSRSEGNLSMYAGLKRGPIPVSFTTNDIILYALGVGAKVSHADTKDLRFLYEGHENFHAIPSYFVLIGMNLSADLIATMSHIDHTQLLHGEQAFKVHTAELPTSGTVKGMIRIAEVLDKGKGVVIVVEVDCYDEEMQTLLFSSQSCIYVRGAGGYGGQYKSKHIVPPIPTPQRAPDAQMQEVIPESQAALYRLNGDKNPLHIDYEFAALAGFDRPIVHGLCFYGFAIRHVLRTYCNNDPTRLAGFKGRFSKPVIPGQTLVTEMWEERGSGKVVVRCKVKETGEVVLSGAHADVKFGTEEKRGNELQQGGNGLKSSAYFHEIEKRIKSTPSLSKVNGIFHWSITEGGKPVADYVIDLKNKPPSFHRGSPKSKADVTLTVSDEDFVSIAQGKVSAQTAFFKGILKVKGNIMLTQKLESILKFGSKL